MLPVNERRGFGGSHRVCVLPTGASFFCEANAALRIIERVIAAQDERAIVQAIKIIRRKTVSPGTF